MPKILLNGIEYASGLDQLYVNKIGTATLHTQADNLCDAVNELKGTLGDLFKRVNNQTGTTDSNGNIAISKPTGVSIDIVLFGWDNQHIFIPFYYNGGWYFRVTSTNAAGTAITNQSITYSYFYIGT